MDVVWKEYDVIYCVREPNDGQRARATTTAPAYTFPHFLSHTIAKLFVSTFTHIASMNDDQTFQKRIGCFYSNRFTYLDSFIFSSIWRRLIRPQLTSVHGWRHPNRTSSVTLIAPSRRGCSRLFDLKAQRKKTIANKLSWFSPTIVTANESMTNWEREGGGGGKGQPPKITCPSLVHFRKTFLF